MSCACYPAPRASASDQTHKAGKHIEHKTKLGSQAKLPVTQILTLDLRSRFHVFPCRISGEPTATLPPKPSIDPQGSLGSEMMMMMI